MLEPVIKNQDVALQILNRPFRCRRAIAVADNGGFPAQRFRQHQRFIAGTFHVAQNLQAIRDENALMWVRTSIAARKNANTKRARREFVSNPLDQRSLAGAAGRNISDADYRHGNVCGAKGAARMQSRAGFHGYPVEETERGQRDGRSSVHFAVVASNDAKSTCACSGCSEVSKSEMKPIVFSVAPRF